jgi:hypothetical protein
VDIDLEIAKRTVTTEKEKSEERELTIELIAKAVAQLFTKSILVIFVVNLVVKTITKTQDISPCTCLIISSRRL